MEDELITPNEINSELTGINKGEKQQKKKQLIIGIAAGSSLLLIILIVILITVLAKKDDTAFIGEINCIFDIKSTTRNTKILGNDFDKGKNNLNIYIDGEKIKYSKEFKFKTAEEYKVRITFSENLNMDYMFKDVEDLISVDMLEDFFSLPCDFSTTDFVISEIIQPAQIKAIDKYA